MQNKKIIIGLVGGLASGKGTIANYLKEHYGANIYRFSTMLRDVLNRLYLEISRENQQILSTIIRKNFGEDTLAKVIAMDVENDKNNIIAVDGIRRMADIAYLEKIDGFQLIKIEAKPEIRYNRLVKRNENEGDGKKTFADFLNDEKKEADAEIPLVMKKATKTINNNKDFKELYKQIDIIIKTTK